MIVQMENFNPSLEIRKLPLSKLKNLVEILEENESWKILMNNIPKKLEKNVYTCDVRDTNPRKYKTEQFRIVENYSKQSQRHCTQILFEEWGTSGKIRPTLGHLLHLLTKAQLFKAADYIAVYLLNISAPNRPCAGPAAPISIDILLPNGHPQSDEGYVEHQLDKIGHVSKAVEEIKKYSSEPHTPDYLPAPPAIVISEAPENDNFCVQIVKQRETSDMIQFSTCSTRSDINSSASGTSQSSAVSDMMKFSSPEPSACAHSDEEIVPDISGLLIPSDSNVPIINLDNSTENNILEQSGEAGFSLNLPVSDILRNDDSTDVPKELPLEEGFVPNLSLILHTAPKLSDTLAHANFETNNIRPDFTNSLSPTNSTINGSQYSSNSQNTSYNSTKCSSPLPNLSLNTLLPHFEYRELELSTNGFSKEPFTTEKEPGRFLGSGAFGAVFLAKGLLDKPVAVKKILLENVDEVNVDDRITKQFKTEVEILSQYKHENLLSLLGYSCDGCTYCLLYDYMPGGTLRDRLKGNDPQLKLLNWVDRYKIALGTAKAVSYLHTGELIHRDIKSANILLDAFDNAKLCDFGLIELLPDQKTKILTTVLGTSAYMAPEAGRGDISFKLDSFSFGVVLLELLSSLAPYDKNRENYDLVTHVQELCDNSIEPLLDKSVGDWKKNNIDFAEELFQISLQCLVDKKARKLMSQVTEALEGLWSKM